MKSAGKRQSEINEETYKTNVTDQDEPKNDCRKSTDPNAQNLENATNWNKLRANRTYRECKWT